MARMLTTTIRPNPEDAEAPLARARKSGLSNRRAPSTGLFVSTDLKLGEESELFKDLKR